LSLYVPNYGEVFHGSSYILLIKVWKPEDFFEMELEYNKLLNNLESENESGTRLAFMR
jgi:hypothetical protein